MSRIVLTTWGSLGDLHPIIASGLGLLDRGHDIVLATTEDYRIKVESLGLKFHAIRPDLPNDPPMVERIMDPKTGPETVLKAVILGNVKATYDDLIAIAKDADFLVAHKIVYAAPLVAEVLKLPWASCALAPAAFFSAYEPIVTSVYPALAKLHHLGPTINSWVVNIAKFTTRTWGKPLYKLRKELGLSPIQNPVVGNDKYSPYLVLALFSSALASPQPDLPSRTVTTGFSFYDGKQEQHLTTELDAFLAIMLLWEPNPKERKKSYHHGELASVLVRTGRTMLERDGLRQFSLRTLAREAGVSNAAVLHSKRQRTIFGLRSSGIS